MEIKPYVIPSNTLLVEINQQTSFSERHLKESLEAAHKAKHDLDRKARLKAHECKFCFYIRRGRFGGAAITKAHCRACGDEMTFSSTAVDRFCKKCSDTYEMCVQCGADLEGRHPRRKLTYKESK